MKFKIVAEPKHMIGSGKRDTDGVERHLMIVEVYGDIDEAKSKFKKGGWIDIVKQGEFH